MKRIIENLCLLIFISITVTNCKQVDNSHLINGASIQHYCEQKLTDVIVYDIFSPPVSSRIYAYSNLAFYEAIRFADTSNPSILQKLKGFKQIPSPAVNQMYNYDLAAIVAFMKVYWLNTNIWKNLYSKDQLRLVIQLEKLYYIGLLTTITS
jgi:hypothetical protein